MPKKAEFKLTGEQRAEVARRYEAGESRAACARALNVSRWMVRQILHRHGAGQAMPRKTPVRLTEEQQAEVVRRCRDGESRGDCARDFNVSLPTLYRILHKHGVDLHGSEWRWDFAKVDAMRERQAQRFERRVQDAMVYLTGGQRANAEAPVSQDPDDGKR